MKDMKGRHSWYFVWPCAQTCIACSDHYAKWYGNHWQYISVCVYHQHQTNMKTDEIIRTHDMGRKLQHWYETRLDLHLSQKCRKRRIPFVSMDGC